MSDILETIADLEDSGDLELLEEEDFILSGTDLEILDAYEITEEEAIQITSAIKSTTKALVAYIWYAHKHKIHKAMGYETWADYVKEELEISPQRSYQLLDLSKVTNEIENVTPEGTEIELTEAQARDIKRELPKITERIRESTEDLDPESASEEVDRIIQEHRDQKKADEKVTSEKQKEIAEAIEEAERRRLEDQADAILEADRPNSMTDSADNEIMEVEVSGDDFGSLSPQDSMDIYNFFNILEILNSMPEPDVFIKVLPKDKLDEANELLLNGTAWMNKFHTILEMQDF